MRDIPFLVEKMTAVEARLTEVRARLVRELKGLKPNGVMAFQRRLAAAFMADLEAPAPTCKRHIHLLRSIGDGLTWSLIPEHTIRTLNRHPSSTPSLKGQQRGGFAFTMRVADQLSSAGLTVVVTDLTHLLRVGDLVVVRDAGVAILECKNSPMPPAPPTYGRLARQRERGERAGAYLRSSSVTEPNGIIRQAVVKPLEMKPAWKVLQRAVAAACRNTSGVGFRALDSRDYVIAVSARSFNAAATRRRTPFPVRDGWGKPRIAFDTDWKQDPLPFIQSPLTYPISTESAIALLEGQLLIGRAVDLSLIECETHLAGQHIRLCVDADAMVVTCMVGDDLQIELPTMLPTILYSAIPIRVVRDCMLNVIGAALNDNADWDGESSEIAPRTLAPGDDSIYATAYRGDDGQVQMMLRAQDLR
jgi:hypothetical protein